MIALECDRCGALYRKQSKYPEFQVHWQDVEHPGRKNGKWYDLCPECQKDLVDWVMMMEDDYETEEDPDSSSDA